MRIPQMLLPGTSTPRVRPPRAAVRGALTVAALAAGPVVCSPAAFAADANPITVTASGSTVRVATTSCAGGGNTALLASGQADFAQGRQAVLADRDDTRDAAWQSVTAGTYTVIVHCSDGSTAGKKTVTVSGTTGAPTISATSAPSSPSASASASTSAPVSASPASSTPALGVQGGSGGGIQDYGTATLAGGGVLVLAGVAGGVWYLRRRAQRSL